MIKKVGDEFKLVFIIVKKTFHEELSRRVKKEAPKAELC
jgi:hypothetical protein